MSQKITFDYNNRYFELEFNYSPEEQQAQDSPGAPEEFEILDIKYIPTSYDDPVDEAMMTSIKQEIATFFYRDPRDFIAQHPDEMLHGETEPMHESTFETLDEFVKRAADFDQGDNYTINITSAKLKIPKIAIHQIVENNMLMFDASNIRPASMGEDATDDYIMVKKQILDDITNYIYDVLMPKDMDKGMLYDEIIDEFDLETIVDELVTNKLQSPAPAATTEPTPF